MIHYFQLWFLIDRQLLEKKKKEKKNYEKAKQDYFLLKKNHEITKIDEKNLSF